MIVTRLFKKLKELLTSASLLGHFQKERDMYLMTDAFKIGIGCVYDQCDSTTKRHYPVTYISRT